MPRQAGKPAGRKEGAPSVKPVRNKHAGNKTRPNSAGTAKLTPPKFGQIAGGSGGGSGSMQPKMSHDGMTMKMPWSFINKEFEPRMFKKNAIVKVDMPLYGVKTQGKIVTVGEKGIRILSQEGLYWNVLWNEVVGLVPPPQPAAGNGKPKAK